MPKSLPEQPPIVRNLSKPFAIENGLQNRHIAVWGSHGWYFDAAQDRWKWQRARVYQIVEDLLPTSFVQPYLLPMLENAGANVFMPRERDLQRNEVIVDVAGEGSGQMIFATGDTVLKATTELPGFAVGKLPYSDRENPFRQGSHWQFPASPTETATVLWVPEIPESGEYAVYVSYRSLPNSVADARYTVNHRGGATEFSVNQRIGGGTWIYLGTFPFEKGINPDAGSVTLSNESESPNGVITADALRFGGGMGIVSRNGKTSGRPRYMEGSRYYLQTMGMPDTLVYNLTEDWQNDYVDDYRSRGEWVNYLRGAPFGPNKNRMANGLNIPIDVSLAFHTDAGSTGDSSTIGTLMIVGVEGADSTDLFPDGVSRLPAAILAMCCKPRSSMIFGKFTIRISNAAAFGTKITARRFARTFRRRCWNCCPTTILRICSLRSIRDSVSMPAARFTKRCSNFSRPKTGRILWCNRCRSPIFRRLFPAMASG
ncbi:MAG: hypothetical protein R3C26_13940 [Calditrichia bacterium]